MDIPLVDLKSQYETIKDEIDRAISSVFERSEFIMGSDVKLFEEEFAKFCGAKFCVGVSSGTDALHLALLACGIGKGDEVITVPNTFIATTEAITMSGAKIVFVDIDPESYNIDKNQIKKAITSKTKAIIPVHLYGQPADMDAITKIAKENSLFVIEDASQAHGAFYRGKRVGAIGDIGCFSFYPGKNLGAYGDAGAIVTNNKELADKVKLLRDHGRIKKYEHEIEGFNKRIDSIQAAVLRVKLRHLDRWNELRREKALLYNKLIENYDGIITPKIIDEAISSYHLYVIRTKKRDLLQRILKEKNISTGIHYPIPLHLQPAYRYLGCKNGDFPQAEKAVKEILSLPLYPELSNHQIEKIVAIIKESPTS